MNIGKNVNKIGGKNGEGVTNKKEDDSNQKTNITPVTKKWNVKDDIMASMKKSANKFAILGDLGSGELNEDPVCKKFKEIDRLLLAHVLPTVVERLKWDKEMNEYFDKHWDVWNKKNKGNAGGEEQSVELEEVAEIYSEAASFLTANEIGMDCARRKGSGGPSKFKC